MSTLKKVIGIVSYFPDDQEVTNARYKKLCALLTKCHELFNLPVIIIAQNWKSELVRVPWATIYRYPDKLGIVGARKELRKKFLTSEFDYLIMIDDDCEVAGQSGKEYLKQIDENPGCFIEFNKTLLKLFAISKEVLSKVDYEDINPESGEGFEDRIFVNKLRALYPELRREFTNTGLAQYSESTADPLSTWYKDQNLNSMIEKTLKKIAKLNDEN